MCQASSAAGEASWRLEKVERHHLMPLIIRRRADSDNLKDGHRVRAVAGGEKANSGCFAVVKSGDEHQFG